MTYVMHQYTQAARLMGGFASTCVNRIREPCDVREAEIRRVETKTRRLRWIESLWEGANTTAREEDQKEEVLAVFKELARESRKEEKVPEYVPWQPLW